MSKFRYALPRVLAIIIVVFLSLFILEGLGPDFGWQDSVMHAVVALIALGVTIVAWKWPKIGGWFYLLIGLYLVIPALWGSFDPLIFGVILLTIGALFLHEGFYQSVPHI